MAGGYVHTGNEWVSGHHVSVTALGELTGTLLATGNVSAVAGGAMEVSVTASEDVDLTSYGAISAYTEVDSGHDVTRVWARGNLGGVYTASDSILLVRSYGSVNANLTATSGVIGEVTAVGAISGTRNRTPQYIMQNYPWIFGVVPDRPEGSLAAFHAALADGQAAIEQYHAAITEAKALEAGRLDVLQAGLTAQRALDLARRNDGRAEAAFGVALAVTGAQTEMAWAQNRATYYMQSAAGGVRDIGNLILGFSAANEAAGTFALALVRTQLDAISQAVGVLAGTRQMSLQASIDAQSGASAFIKAIQDAGGADRSKTWSEMATEVRRLIREGKLNTFRELAAKIGRFLIAMTPPMLLYAAVQDVVHTYDVLRSQTGPWEAAGLTAVVFIETMLGGRLIDAGWQGSDCMSGRAVSDKDPMWMRVLEVGGVVAQIVLNGVAVTAMLGSAAPRAAAQVAQSQVNRSPQRILQEMLDTTVRRIAADPTKIAYTKAEMEMFSKGISAKTVFGRVVERELARDIARSAEARGLFMWTKDIEAFAKGGISTPGDFIGIGRAEGNLFEVTTVTGAASHAARWNGFFGDLVYFLTYVYPL